MDKAAEPGGEERAQAGPRTVRGIFLLLGFGACWIAVLTWTWRTWPDVLVDFGRELYVPWRLIQGERLYEDIAYFNGPLSPHVNALWFRLFGPGLCILASANIAIAALLCALLYREIRYLCCSFAATCCAALFTMLFAASQLAGIGNYNFICPYSHEMTHGLLLAVLSLTALRIHLREKSVRWVAASGALAGLVALTKPELLLANASACVLGLACSDRPRIALRRVAVLIASAAIPPLVAIGLLSIRIPFETALRGLMRPYAAVFSRELTGLLFYKLVRGTLPLSKNLTWMATACGLWLGALLAAAAIARALPRWRTAMMPAALGLLTFGLFLALGSSIPWLESLRPLPLFLLFGGAISARNGIRLWDSSRRERSLLVSVWCLFALALLLKILFAVRAAHYGFALAMPGTLLLVGLALGPLANRMAGTERAAVFRAILCGVFAGLLAGHLREVRQQLQRKSYELGSGCDELRTDPVRGEMVKQTLGALDELLPRQASLVVLPEGVMLNYLARRKSSSAHINFMPPELILFEEETILEDLRAHPPDAVVLVHKDTSEYGFPLFGAHYGRSILTWVRENYSPVRLFGDRPLEPGSRFGMAVLLPRP